MAQIPYSANYINFVTAAVNPSGITVDNTKAASFFRRYLLQKAMSVFTWSLPPSWSREYFLYTLYCTGSVAVVKTDKFGTIPQGGTPGGYTVMYQPLYYTISNPLLKGILQPVIGKQCCVFRMTSDWGGIMDLVSFYGDLMALTAQAAGSNLINSRLAYMFRADNDGAAKSFYKAFDEILKGKPAVAVDKALTGESGSVAENFFQNNLSQNFIAPELFETLRTIENMFCTAVGIPNTNTNKKERMPVAEVNANNVETETLADMWLSSWKNTCAECKRMFNINISVDWRVDRGSRQEVEI